MKRIDACAAAGAAVAARPDRPAMSILHDVSDARLVVFHIEPGQRVAPHTSTSSVVLVVVQGTSFVTGADGETEVRAGTLVAYEPNELHGMRAVSERLVIAAVITPRPGSR